MTLTRKQHTTIFNGVTKLDLFISYSKVRIFIGLFPEATVLPPTVTLAIISFMMLVSFLSESPPMKRYEFYLPFNLQKWVNILNMKLSLPTVQVLDIRDCHLKFT